MSYYVCKSLHFGYKLKYVDSGMFSSHNLIYVKNAFAHCNAIGYVLVYMVWAV